MSQPEGMIWGTQESARAVHLGLQTLFFGAAAYRGLSSVVSIDENSMGSASAVLLSVSSSRGEEASGGCLSSC
jgi:hypothetical protein